MDLEQFKRVEEVFESAMALPPEQREAYVDRACAGDDAAAGRVRRMLQHAQRELVCDELDAARSAHTGPIGGGDAAAIDELSGSTIGPYQLIERIGEGGFGVVYRAQQTAPVRRMVALKIIKLGMDTRQVIARFGAERQALALMDHPHIARVFDAGVTDSGRPYFVMALVGGVPVTRFCDDRRLPLRERLRLFIQICQAVQHAHGKGVIHRDLKPSNILVTSHEGAASPTIIDFGIAKATRGRLADRTVLTEFRQFIGTPEYMSPEQALGGVEMADVDTRSDVYSLGVLLHELLVGVTPFDLRRTSASPLPEDVLRLIRDHEPRRPSTRISALGERVREIAERRSTEPHTLRRMLRGDLDWIILKAMEKQPSRRYETAADLAHEIERHLNNRPIDARPPSMAYLAAKFVRRHRVLVTAGAAIGLALVLGLVAALAGLRQANMARHDQQLALDEARARLAESLLAQARAARSGAEIGRRYQALAAIAQSAELDPRLHAHLRDEAIACMTISDFRPLGSMVTRDLFTASARFGALVAHIPAPGEIAIASIPEGREIIRLAAPAMQCWVLEFSPDGRYLAAKFHDRPDDAHIVVWDISRREPLFDLHEGAVEADQAVFCTVNGETMLAVGGQSPQLNLFSLPEGSKVKSIATASPPFWMAAEPPGGSDRIAVSHLRDDSVTIWSLRTGEHLATIDAPALVRGMTWAGNGTQLLTGTGDYDVHLWDAGTGERLGGLAGHKGVVVDVHYDPRSGLVGTSAWDNTTRLWDLATGEQIVQPIANGRIAGFGETLAINFAGQTSFWRYEPSQEFRMLRAAPRGSEFAVRLDRAGRFAVTATAGGVQLWDLSLAASDPAARAPVAVTDVPATFARLTGDGASVIAATAQGLLRWPLLDADSASGAIRVGEPQRLLERASIIGFELDQRDALIVVLTRQRIEVFEFPSMNSVFRQPAYPGLEQRPSLDPLGRWLFTGNWRGEQARVWDIATGEAIRRFTSVNVQGAFSPDGRRLAISTGATFDIYQTDPWAIERTLQRDHAGELAGHVAFAGTPLPAGNHDPESRGGRNIAAITHSRFEVRLIDLDTGETLASLAAPGATVISGLALSADGSTLAASTSDGELLVWNLARIRDGLTALGLQAW